MKNIRSATYYIENLTVDSWVRSILPYFLKNRASLQEAQHIYYFNNSGAGLWLANFTLWFAGKELKRADFSQGGTRDLNGDLVWMKTMEDARALHEDLNHNSAFQRIIENYGKANSLRLFLGKWFMYSDLVVTDTFSLLKFIFLVRCVEHHENLHNGAGMFEQNVLLFMRERPWFAEIARFAQSKGVVTIPTRDVSLYLSILLVRFDGSIIFIKELCKRLVYYAMGVRYKFKKLFRRSNGDSEADDTIGNGARGFKNHGPRMALEHYGYLNFDSPEMFSDVFFLQKSSLSSQEILIYFGLPSIPIREEEWNDIRKRGMSAVAINPLATTTPGVPLFSHKREKAEMDRFNDAATEKKDIVSHKWLQRYVSDYYRRYDYWADFIAQHNIKMDVAWYKYSPDHCARLDALKNAGGVGAVYQRSYDFFVAPWTFTTADVVFGFSKLGAHLEQDKNSVIPYYVITGYLGDYRFDLLRKPAGIVRERIKNNGAKKIVAYFDEHARNHPRWNLAYRETLEHYAYLLNKVLENPWLGLILKPKVPATLRSRLGPVSDLLRRAEKTGRCFVFEDGTWQGFYPPALASLGADVAIHGHLFAATAGIESVLAGTPTLMLDGEGTPRTQLNNLLGNGRVIFRDMEHLWQACVEHWNTPGGIPGFADWSDAFDALDPFRDGRSAERMGDYLKWLMEGFKAGLPRETVLADAAERYGKIWGTDKIISVNCGLKVPEYSPAESVLK